MSETTASGGADAAGGSGNAIEDSPVAAAGVAPGTAAREVNRTDLPVRLVQGESADESLTDGIALCLSGGGYRAMVFHVGTLWRLNEAGLLSKLSRVSSVSGGSITAGVLGMFWGRLMFDAKGIAQDLNLVVQAIRQMAGRTIDEGSILGGIFTPGTIGDKVTDAYDKYLFRGATLQSLPADGQGPRFTLNATSVQTGSLWRFSRPFMGDYRVGLIRNPALPLARAVAASSAFPPVLSPVTLDVDPGDFDRSTAGPLFAAPYNDTVVLSDGGVYDNMGLETAFKRCKTVLVSDAGMKMAPEGEPKSDWPRHSMRVLDLIDNQVRSLRKRQLVDAYKRGQRTGAYWGVGTHFADYQVPDPLGVGGADTAALAAVPTRLKAMPADLQDRLINWGYAVCDAALRAHWGPELQQRYGVRVANPLGFPYPRGL